VSLLIVQLALVI